MNAAASASARQWAGAAPGKGGLGQAAETDPFKFKLPNAPACQFPGPGLGREPPPRARAARFQWANSERPRASGRAPRERDVR